MVFHLRKAPLSIYWFTKHRYKSISHWIDFYLKFTGGRSQNVVDWNLSYKLSFGMYYSLLNRLILQKLF